MPGQEQRPQKGEVEHLAELPVTQVENDQIQGLGVKATEIADEQLQKRSIKVEVVPIAGWENPQDCLAMQETLDLEVEGAAVLWEHRRWDWDLLGNEEPVPIAHSIGVRVVQISEQFLQEA